MTAKANLYQRLVPSPAVEAAGLGLGAGGLAYAAYGPVVDTFYSLYRPIYAAAHGGSVDGRFYEMYEQERNSRATRLGMSIGAGLLAAAASAAKNYRPNERFYGLAEWNAPLDRGYRFEGTRNWGGRMPGAFAKRGSFDDAFGTGGLDLDYSRRISGNDTCMMFTNDPFMANNDYVRNFSTSVIRGAQRLEGTMNPTLGAVQDSAESKMGSRLSFGSVLGTAARAVVANQASRLFAGAVGTMMDLPQGTRDNIVSAGTWGMLLNDIISLGD